MEQDFTGYISQRLHKYLKENNVLHIWPVEPGVHDFKVWKSYLYYFSQQIIKKHFDIQRTASCLFLL
jgi:enterochelin esterase-like enzyme